MNDLAPASIDELYGDFWADDAAIMAAAATSLHPRGSDVLYDHFARFGVGPGDVVADIGSRDASYAVELHRRFGCRVVAVDPVPLHADLARATVAAAGLDDVIEIHRAGIEALPVEDGSLAAIWCRDVLNHVDLAAGLAECARALRPDGEMMAYQTFATDLLEPTEAARLYRALALTPDNMDPTYFEATARAAGFEITACDVMDSEWRERWAEDGTLDPGTGLVELARMRRREADLVARFGRARYEATYNGALWGPYQFLGKLRPMVYLLRNPG